MLVAWRSSAFSGLKRYSRLNSQSRWLTTKEPLVVSSTDELGATVIRMNNPQKYNAWTTPMLRALHGAMKEASTDEATKVVIITGTGKYYCAGVDLAGTLKPMWPAALKKKLYEMNIALFDIWLDFPKPLIAAINGPAIGASVTSATLCDAVIAANEATFSTPFARLAIPPEGCSSFNFPRLMGIETANRILGPEAWVPTGSEAKVVGLVTDSVPSADLIPHATRLAHSWITNASSETTAKSSKRIRSHMGYHDTAHLKKVNDTESVQLADAFLAPPFLRAQANFLRSKGKTLPATFFQTLLFTRPLWKLML